MAMDNSDSEIGNLLPPHGLLFPNSSNVVVFFIIFYLHHPTDRITPAVELWVEKEGNSYLTYFCLSHIIFKQDVTLNMFIYLRTFIRFVVSLRICCNTRSDFILFLLLLCVGYCSCCSLLFLFVCFLFVFLCVFVFLFFLVFVCFWFVLFLFI